MKIRIVTVIPGAMKIFERDKCYELWSPASQNSRIVYRLVKDSNGVWRVTLPFEQETNKNTTFPSPESYNDDDDIEVSMFNQTLRFPPPLSSTKTDAAVTLLTIRTYALQPLFNHDTKTRTWQHVSDVCVLATDLGTCFERESTFLPEARYVETKVFHERFTFEVEGGDIIVRKGVTPETVLRQIYNEFIQKEMDWGNVELPVRKQFLAPISVCVTGIPLKSEAIDDRDGFSMYRGVSAQARWRLEPLKGTKFASNEWVVARLKEAVAIQGRTLAEFMDTCHTHFTNVPLSPRSCKPLHDCLVAVGRMCTMWAESFPYVPDKRYVNDKGDKVEGDWLDFQRFGMDCEDGALFVYMLVSSILMTDERDGPVMQVIRQCLVAMGIPVGISGLARSLSDATKTVGHMYGALVPVPVLYEMLFHSPMTPKDLTRTKRWLIKRYRLLSTHPDQLIFCQHAMVIETTVLATPYYGERGRVSSNKRAFYQRAKSLLHDKYKELDINWTNYALQHPFAYDEEKGALMHSKVFRIFTAHVPNFFPREVLNGNNINYDIQHSFIVNKREGVPGEDFFGRKAGTLCRLSVSTPMSQQVYDKESYILQNFTRPIVTLTEKPDGYSPFKMIDGYTVMDEEVCFDNTATIPKNHNDRFYLFVWRIKPQELQAVINDLVKGDKSKKVKLCRYGNCFCVVIML